MTGGYAGGSAECVGFPGAPVIIRDLKSAAQYNDCRGVIRSGPNENGRWEVAITPEDGSELKVLALKPANFQVDVAAIIAGPKQVWPKREGTITDQAILWRRGKGLGAKALTLRKTEVRELKEGEVLIYVEKFAMTAATLGYLMKGFTRSFSAYHNFFPWDEEGLYRSGTYGFARVRESKHPKVQEGTRLYGFLPLAEYTIETVDQAIPPRDGEPGFIDFRREKVNFELRHFNEYEVVPENLGDDAWTEDYRMTFKEAYTSAYYIDEQLMCDCGMINACVISCASSKIAVALAYCLSMRVDDCDLRMQKMRNIVGLTTPEHAEFVKSTGLYTEVILYDEIPNKLPNKTVVFVDIKYDGELTQKIIGKMGPSLMYTLVVGPPTFQKKVQNQIFDVKSREKIFNAGEWREKRTMANEVIKTGRDERLVWSYKSFIDRCQKLYTLKQVRGPQAMLETLKSFHENTLIPSEVLVCSLSSGDEDEEEVDEVWK